MCLAVPFEVIEIAGDKSSGKVMMSGAPCEVGFALLDDVEVGDYVLVHAGMAIQRLSRDEAEDSLSMLRQFADTVAQQNRETPPRDDETR